MYTSMNTSSRIIFSPGRLKFRDNNVYATDWHHRQRAGRHRGNQSNVWNCKMFWILKVPLFPKWSRSEIASNLYLMLDEKHQWLRLHETFRRGEAGEQSAVSGLLSVAEKQLEIGVERRNQIDKDSVYGKAGQKVEEAGGRLDALPTAISWVIQWSSSLHSANNKVQEQTFGNILGLTEVSQSLKDTSKCPASLQTFKSVAKSAPRQHGHGLVPPQLSMSFLLPACKRAPRGTEGKEGALFSLAGGSEAMEIGRQRGVSPGTGRASPVT